MNAGGMFSRALDVSHSVRILANTQKNKHIFKLKVVKLCDILIIQH